MKKEYKKELKGERLILKLIEPNLEIAQEMFDVIDRNREHLKPWMEWVDETKSIFDTIKFLVTTKEILYGIYIDGKYRGNISMIKISDYHKKGEFGYWLDSEVAGNGYMAEVVRILEKYFFEEIGLNRITIRCDAENQASAKTAKNAGYTFEAKIREEGYLEGLGFRDSLMFSKLKSEYEK